MRKLALIGKHIDIKTLATSKLLYPISLIHTDANIIKSVKSAIYQFVWNNYTYKVKSSVMHQSILKGGLKITHVNAQVLASHIKWV